MNEQGMSQGRTPPKGRPFLEVVLKKTWKYDPVRRVFIRSKGEEFDGPKELPKKAAIEMMVSDFAKRKPSSLSSDEEFLSRHYHVEFPNTTDLEKMIAIIRAWPCVESVSIPPEISLPE